MNLKQINFRKSPNSGKLIAKIANFDNIRQNNSVFKQKKKKIAHLKDIISEESLFRQLVMNFANFLRNNSVFMQKNGIFKKYHLRGKLIFC